MSNPSEKSEKKVFFDWRSPLLLEDQLSSEEKLISQTARDYAQNHLKPRVVKAFREEKFDKDIFAEMAQLGFLGATISGYGCAGVNQVSYGLIAREIEYIDSAYRSALSVQSSLVMLPIYLFGSEEQKNAYLPKLAKAELIGCFGLTEPDHGSDPASMETKAKNVMGGVEITGVKTWITNAPLADLFIIWAKNEQGKIQGYVLEKNMKGLTVNKMHGKLSLCISPTGEIVMDKVFVPDDHILPDAIGLGKAIQCLESARLGIAWGAIGAAECCFHIAREYVLERKQFSKLLAANQLIQYKLADMETKIALGLQGCLRVSRLKDEHKASTESISLIKRYATIEASNIAKNAREMLGANGIMEEYSVMRHMINLETVRTYEGTADIHALIMGAGITDISAF